MSLAKELNWLAAPRDRGRWADPNIKINNLLNYNYL